MVVAHATGLEAALVVPGGGHPAVGLGADREAAAGAVAGILHADDPGRAIAPPPHGAHIPKQVHHGRFHAPGLEQLCHAVRSVFLADAAQVQRHARPGQADRAMAQLHGPMIHAHQQVLEGLLVGHLGPAEIPDLTQHPHGGVETAPGQARQVQGTPHQGLGLVIHR